MLYRTHFQFPGHSETRYVDQLPQAGSIVRSRNASWLVHEVGVDDHGFSKVILREPPKVSSDMEDASSPCPRATPVT